MENKEVTWIPLEIRRMIEELNLRKQLAVLEHGRKEYPNFMSGFTQYLVEDTKDKLEEFNNKKAL